MTMEQTGPWAAWRRQSRRRRVGLLLALALVILLAIGVSWRVANPGVQYYRPAIAEVVEITETEPITITVRYELEGQEVVATTDALTFVPAEGGPVPIEFDPADPTQVVMDGYRESSVVTSVLIGLFVITLGLAWWTFRDRSSRSD